MKPNLRMLVATDLGPAGDLALEAAATWARRHGGGGVVLHVSDDEHRAASLAARISAIAGDVAPRFEGLVEEGNKADVVLDVARRIGADMIVLGGRDEASSTWRFGSVAERVVTHAEVPVLVARAHEATGRILALSDLTDASLVAIDPAREIARVLGVRPTALHCIEPEIATEETAYASFGTDPERVAREAKQEAAARLSALVGADFDVEVVAGPIVPTLIDAAEAHDAQLVVTASRCRTGLSRFFLGSVAGALIRTIERSVLVVQRG